MAYQHFFSRVPARMSMFRKCDSFDTFAKSDGITKEYITGSLLKVCEYKPTDDELDLILQDKLPPIYCACFSKDGNDLIQSKFSFVSSDYTGERPSWLCHSLILGKDEQELISSSPDAMLFNRKAFAASLADFPLTDRKSRPIPDYPPLAYPSDEVKGLSEWAAGTDEVMLKKTVFAVMNAAASNQKNIYLSLAKPLEQLSDEAVDFYNRLMLVFPYSVRKSMSFISEYNDAVPTKNYKIRFILGNMVELCSTRGYVVDTGRKVSYGIYEEDLTAVKDEVDFLYGLYSDDATRNAFLKFYESVAAARPEYLNFNLRVFLDLIYLFRRICGRFAENDIIPDDNAVLRMITTYEKYREALEPDDRQRIISIIERYSKNRVAIPAPIFTRIGKIYTTEPEQCKKTVMAVILDLLHTNIMRDKLFGFISSTYESESAESRDIISEDLSRVFYGGFLQSDILDFYSKYFGGESEPTKAIILEKLLMTIRTEAIQKKILEFIDKYQDTMSPVMKQAVYHTFYEMLPENDALSKRIVPVLSKCMLSDTPEVRERVYEKVLSQIAEDEAKGNGLLLEICLTGVRNGLPLGNMLLKKAFLEWSGDKSFGTVLTAFLGSSLSSVGNALRLLWNVVPELPEDSYKQLYEKTSSLLPLVSQKNDLFDFLDFDRKVREGFDENKSANGAEFYNSLYSSVLTGLIGIRLSDAFNISRNKIGLRAVLDYADANEKLKNLPGTEALRSAIGVTELVSQGKLDEAFGVLVKMPLYMESGKLLSETLKAEFKHIEDSPNGDIYRDAVIGAMYSYLENGRILLGGVFGKCLERKRAFDLYSKPVKIRNSAKDIQDEDSEASLIVFGNIVRLCVAVGNTGCAEEVKNALFGDVDSELDKIARRVLSTATKKSKETFGEIYDYARHSSLKIARKLEIAVMSVKECPRAFKKVF